MQEHRSRDDSDRSRPHRSVRSHRHFQEFVASTIDLSKRGPPAPTVCTTAPSSVRTVIDHFRPRMRHILRPQMDANTAHRFTRGHHLRPCRSRLTSIGGPDLKGGLMACVIMSYFTV